MATETQNDILDLYPDGQGAFALYDPDPRYRKRRRSRARALYDAPRRRRRLRTRLVGFSRSVRRRLPFKKGKRKKDAMTLVRKVGPPGLGILAFLFSVGPGDRQGLTGGQAIKMAFASAVTRTSGGMINAYNMLGLQTNQPITMYASPINWNKVFNPFTWLGIALLAYGHYSPVGPERALARKAGLYSLIGGATGGAISSLTGDPAAPANPANAGRSFGVAPLQAMGTGASSRGSKYS